MMADTSLSREKFLQHFHTPPCAKGQRSHGSTRVTFLGCIPRGGRCRHASVLAWQDYLQVQAAPCSLVGAGSERTCSTLKDIRTGPS